MACPPKQFECLEGHCTDWMMYRAAWCFSQPRTGKWIKSASLQELESVREQGKWGDLSCLCCLFVGQWQERGSRMNVGTAHSEVNPNTRVMNSRGIWLSYVLAIGLLHVVLLSIPFVSVPVVWTLTNLIHNMVRACLLPAFGGVGVGIGDPPPQMWARCQGDMLTSVTRVLFFLPHSLLLE